METQMMPQPVMDTLLAYGPLGAIAVMFFIFFGTVMYNGFGVFKESIKKFEEQNSEIYKMYASNNELLRTSLENHNVRTLEILNEIRIELTKNTIHDKQLIDQLDGLIRSQTDYLDEISSVSAEIKLLCPMQNKYRICDILVNRGVITRDKLDEILKEHHGKDS